MMCRFNKLQHPLYIRGMHDAGGDKGKEAGLLQTSDKKESGHHRRQKAKRAAIIAAAEDMFLRQGFGRVSMDQVHARIGGSKRTLYNHFPSKEALYKAIVRKRAEKMQAAASLPDVDADLRATLTAIGRSYLETFLSREAVDLFRAVVSEGRNFPELVETFLESGLGQMDRRLAAFFREQQKKGRLKNFDPALAATHFLGMICGSLHLKTVLCGEAPAPETIERHVVVAVDTFLNGVAATQDG
jgi:AcrR family transcriptional regulator